MHPVINELSSVRRFGLRDLVRMMDADMLDPPDMDIDRIA